MSVASRALERVRQPEYTGENRCIPCTVTNLAIALVVVVPLAIFVSVPLAVAFLVLALGSIWLRGYLVPKTPELTKRYFPDWLLAKFDKHPDELAGTERVTPDDFDPETVLLEAGVVEPCEDVDDLCLTDEFETSWRERMAAFDDSDILRTELAEQLDVDADRVEFESYGEAYIAHAGDGTHIGQWESRSALQADLAAAKELPDRVDDWASLAPRPRSQLLGGLRIFIESCPSCGGPVTADTEVVESCCRSTTVVAVGCESCEDRLLEVPYDEEAVA